MIFKFKKRITDIKLIDTLDALINCHPGSYFNANKWTMYIYKNRIRLNEYMGDKVLIIYKDKLVEVDPKTNLEKILGKSLDRRQLLDILKDYGVYKNLKKVKND